MYSMDYTKTFDLHSDKNSGQGDKGQMTRAVDIKEALAEVGVDWLQQLKVTLQEQVEKLPEPCENWVIEIRKPHSCDTDHFSWS